MAGFDVDDAAALMTELGATRIPNPGGNLLDHSQRVGNKLASWGIEDVDLQIAAVCHALYGTETTERQLANPQDRDEIVARIGIRAESVVYFFSALHRLPLLANPSIFYDRFADATRQASSGEVRDFVLLSVANDLDVGAFLPDWWTTNAGRVVDLATRFPSAVPAAAAAELARALGERIQT